MQNHFLSQNSFPTITLVYTVLYGSLIIQFDVELRTCAALLLMPRTVAKDSKAKAIGPK